MSKKSKKKFKIYNYLTYISIFLKKMYKKNYKLKNLTWFKVGGEAEYFGLINTMQDLEKIKDFNGKIYKLGACSNILIRDGQIEGLFVKLSGDFNYIKREKNYLEVGSATLNYTIANYCLKHGLEGFEFLIGIPGTVGGGIYMNAGAYGNEYKNIIDKIIYFDKKTGKIITLVSNEADFSYRYSKFQNELDFLIIKAHIKIPNNITSSDDHKVQERIKLKMDNIKYQRESSQPIYSKTCGSTFRNPIGISDISAPNTAWQLIDAVGLRGFRYNGACVSEKHSNFLINTGSATASDIFELGELIRFEVFKKFAIDLQWEIKLIGFEPKMLK